MKKWMLFIISSIFMMNVHAKETMYCNYKDYFHLSDQLHPAVYVDSGSSDSDVLFQITSPRSFVIRDNPTFCRAGYAHITVGYDKDHWCLLDIQDGPYMNHPVVKPNICVGMHYISTTYDGFNSYSYTINLD